MKRWFVLLFGVFCYGLFTVLLDFTTALLIVPAQPATNSIRKPMFAGELSLWHAPKYTAS